MPRRIDKVKNVFFTVFSLIWQTDGLAFYSDAPFPFNVHIIKQLITEFPVTHHFTGLDKPVCKGGFPMVNMGNNAKVSNVFHLLSNNYFCVTCQVIMLCCYKSMHLPGNVTNWKI